MALYFIPVKMPKMEQQFKQAMEVLGAEYLPKSGKISIVKLDNNQFAIVIAREKTAHVDSDNNEHLSLVESIQKKLWSDKMYLDISDDESVGGMPLGLPKMAGWY